MTSAADRLVDALRREGMRITRARRQVCAVLAADPKGHLNAAAIASRVRVPMDTSTVYRTLEVLGRLGLVEQVHAGPGGGAYHLASVPAHHHLVCSECGVTIDVPPELVTEAVLTVAERHGFTPDTTHFAIAGRCRTCAGDGQ